MELLPVPDELKSKLVIESRWTMYKNFLDKCGDNYQQIFLTDTRDVVCQGNIFKIFVNRQNYLGYATEGVPIVNKINPVNHTWLNHLFGKKTADKLADKEIICAGTILGSTNEIKKLVSKIIETLEHKKFETEWGDDQATLNYLIYENQLEIKNLIKFDCWSGDIFSVTFFHLMNPPKIQHDKILRGNGGVPAVVHEYPCFNIFIQLIDKLYRDKKFAVNENFTDLRSVLDQIFYLTNIGKIDDAYKIFTKYLFGKSFSELYDRLVKLWEILLTKYQDPIWLKSSRH